MHKLKNALLQFPTFLILAGCVSHATVDSKLNNINTGMSKVDVLSLMGKPDQTASGNGAEDLTYQLNESTWDTKLPVPYVIHLVNGKVDRFGTKQEMIQSELGNTLAGKSQPLDIITEITKLDELRRKKLISDAEYSKKKEKLLDQL
jgi:hypothetical protein